MSSDNRERGRALVVSLDFCRAISDWAELGLVDAAVDALTSELDAAEQRGRAKALEEAAGLIEREQSWWEEALANRLAGRSAGMAEDADRRARDFRTLAAKVRSLGSTGGGR